MSKEETIGERMKAWRARKGLTQERAAVFMGFTRSYLSQIEAGVREGGPRFVRRLIECEQESARPASNSYSLREQSAALLPPGSVRMIPLVSSAQAGIATAFEEIPESWQERIPSTVTDKKAFAITVRGDSMEPRYHDGDMAILLPSSSARNGDLVVANIKEEGFAFKVLTLVGGDPKHLKLTSYNPVYPPMDLPRERFHWIYPVHSVTKVIRR